MKSGIDWNELIPLLPKKLRDDIYLEAVAILSQEDDGKGSPPRTKPKGIRNWRDAGVAGRLNQPGRVFKINKGCRRPIGPESLFGRVWALVKDSKGDTITVEGINSIARGVGDMREADAIWYLWARGYIDI